MKIKLFSHNQIAYELAVSMMEQTGKAAVIHPTGTGKSFIAFKLCEDNATKRICWLSPSSYIFQIRSIKTMEALFFLCCDSLQIGQISVRFRLQE